MDPPDLRRSAMRKPWGKLKSRASLGLVPLKTLIVFLGFMGASGLFCYSILQQVEPLRLVGRAPSPSHESVDLRREIAAQLAEITRDLNSYKKIIGSELPMRLNRIVSQLDIRASLSEAELMSSNRSDPLATPPPDDEDVCAEEYLGNKHGYPFYQEGFVVSSTCDKQKRRPISDLVTMLMIVPAEESLIAYGNRLETVLGGVRGYHFHLPIIIATTSNGVGDAVNKTLETISQFQDVRVMVRGVDEVGTPGKIWNAMAKEVTTPYVLFARDLAYFNAYARLERQIRTIIDTPEVAVVGGAFRNVTGHWKVGCYQTEIKNYFLKYFEGYKYSASDCMFCDHLEGPFVAKTEILSEIPLNEKLSEDVLFEDWFLQMKQANVLVMNCPDAMYFTRGEGRSFGERQQRRQEAWQSLARHWEIHRIFLPPNILYLFSCKEVGLSCDARKWGKAYLLPSCCLLQVARTLRTLDEFATEKGLRYELSAASLLGAVKLRSFTPWERDGHITFDSKDYASYYRHQGKFNARGLKLDSFDPPADHKPGYFKLNTPDLHFEMFGTDTLSTIYLPSEIREKPTRVNVLGVWVRGQANPGLYARNRYGPNYLKHAQFWQYLGVNDGSGRYSLSGRWMACPKSYHHACLDHYPNDGSIEFNQQLNH